MTPEQERHLAYIMSVVPKLLDSKYRRGAKEHGNTLLGMNVKEVLLEQLAECLDNLIFTLTALQKIDGQ